MASELTPSAGVGGLLAQDLEVGELASRRQCSCWLLLLAFTSLSLSAGQGSREVPSTHGLLPLPQSRVNVRLRNDLGSFVKDVPDFSSDDDKAPGQEGPLLLSLQLHTRLS